MNHSTARSSALVKTIKNNQLYSNFINFNKVLSFKNFKYQDIICYLIRPSTSKNNETQLCNRACKRVGPLNPFHFYSEAMQNRKYC